jgi:AraC-like DNA-binding protein
MYEPKGYGKEKRAPSVEFNEVKPPTHLSEIVHRFLELKTNTPLSHDYCFHALPDACTYIVFNQKETKVAGVTKLTTTSKELNLGKIFHYINIRLLPGVWQTPDEKVSNGMIGMPYTGTLPLVELNSELNKLNFTQTQTRLSKFIEALLDRSLVAPNRVIKHIFENLDEIHTVQDMAFVSSVSPRQLQRVLKQTTGFTPHDFLKILRLQRTLSGHHTPSYTDQSHFIHSFRKATGYTPTKYSQKYDV